MVPMDQKTYTLCCLLCLNCIVFCLLFEVFQFSIFFFQSPSVQIREVSFFWNILIGCSGTLQQVFSRNHVYTMIERVRNKTCVHWSIFLPIYLKICYMLLLFYTTGKECSLIPTYDWETLLTLWLMACFTVHKYTTN